MLNRNCEQSLNFTWVFILFNYLSFIYQAEHSKQKELRDNVFSSTKHHNTYNLLSFFLYAKMLFKTCQDSYKGKSPISWYTLLSSTQSQAFTNECVELIIYQMCPIGFLFMWRE